MHRAEGAAKVCVQGWQLKMDELIGFGSVIDDGDEAYLIHGPTARLEYDLIRMFSGLRSE